MSEDELLASVQRLARALGVKAFHEHDSRRNPVRGFPDLVLAGKAGVIFAELKSTAGLLSPAQASWKWELLAGRQDWQLWRPADWHTGHIERELRRIGCRPQR